jgi:nucleoside-diphosphate-sugar epimerase
VYGPRDAEFLRVFVMARRGLLPRIGDGGQPISLIHVSDLVAALVAVSSAPCAAHVHFAAHPQPISTLDLALAIHRAVHRALGDAGRPARRARVLPVPTVAARTAMTVIGALARLAGRRTLVNADKARELAQAAWTCCAEPLEEHTGWRARVPLDDGLTDTARWYRTHGRL